MNLKQRLSSNDLDPRDPEHDDFEDWEEEICKRIENDLLTEGEADYISENCGRYIEKTITLTECIGPESIDPGELNNMLLEILKAKYSAPKLNAFEALVYEIKNQISVIASDAANEECHARIQQANRGEGEFSNEP